MVDRPVAFVTGGSRGIGRAICIELARHGHDVVPAARTTAAGTVPAPYGTIEETAGQARRYGADALPVVVDVGDLDSVRRGFAAAQDRFGRVDVVVNTAVHEDMAPDATFFSQFAGVRWESLEAHVGVVVTGTLLLIRLALPGMIERRRGVVMNITQNRVATRRPPRLPMVSEPPITEWLEGTDHALPGDGMVGSAVPITRGVTDRLAPALRRELEPHGVAMLTLDPTMTLSNPGMHLNTEALKLGYRPDLAHSVLVPARAAAYIATCRNPQVFNGQFVVAEDLVRSFGLMTEEDMYPPVEDGPPDPETLPPLGPAFARGD